MSATNIGNRIGPERRREATRNLGEATAPGEHVEHELNAFIVKRHNERVRTEGELIIEELWRASEKREEARRTEEERAGRVAMYRHLHNVYTRRAAHFAELAGLTEGAP